MSQTVSSLSARIMRLEEEITLIRGELTELRRQTDTSAQAVILANAHLWADKAVQQRSMNNLFALLNIRGQPTGVHILQKQIEDAGLDQNELSDALIAARQE